MEIENLEKLEQIEKSVIEDISEVKPLECKAEGTEAQARQLEESVREIKQNPIMLSSGCRCTGGCGSDYSQTSDCRCTGSCGSNYHK